MKYSLLIALILPTLFLSCSTTEEEKPPLNEITDLHEFTNAIAKEKYASVVPIKAEEIYGNWKIVASFFTIKSAGKVSTFELEGRKMDIKKDGHLTIDNSAFNFGPKYRMWKLKDGNKVFDDGHESHRIRVSGNTMELIQKLQDDDFAYFVLKREE